MLKIFSSILLVVFFQAQLFSQSPVKPRPESSILIQEIAALNESAPSAKRGSICDRIYQSGDADLILAALNHPKTFEFMWVRMMKEVNLDLQRRNVLLAFRGDPQIFDGTRYLEKMDPLAAARGMRLSYCLEILHRYLPADTFKRYPLSIRQNRLYAAYLLEGKLATADSPPVWLNDVKVAVKSAALAAPNSAGKVDDPPIPIALGQSERAIWIWIVGGIALLCGAAIIFSKRIGHRLKKNGV